MWTNKRKGNRIIVGGFSPSVHHVPADFLKTGAIVGVKGWARVHPCDYWVGLDTELIYKRDFADFDDRYKEKPKYVRDLKAHGVPMFLRKPNISSEKFVPQDFGIWFDKAPHPTIPTKWTRQLQFCSSSAMAAISLAIVLGAAEIVLCAVDFVGETRADGSRYVKDGFWREHIPTMNGLLARFQQHVKIYKTHPDSPLDLPLMEVGHV
jgi:hypothetical protein